MSEDIREVGRLRLSHELSVACESLEHDVDHAEVNQGFAGFRSAFAVHAESAIIVDPRDRSHHHPATRQDREAFGFVGTFHNLQPPVTDLFHPRDELSGMATVGLSRPAEKVM